MCPEDRHVTVYALRFTFVGARMHEVGLMQGILDAAGERADQHGAERIHRISLLVGALSGVVPEALEFAFQVLSPDTASEGAVLEIERVPVLCLCPACDADFEPADYVYECPQCRRITDRVLRGRELQIVSIEVS